MPKKAVSHAVRLEFGEHALVSTNLSGAAFLGEDLWVAGDEACALTRLKRLPPVGEEVLRYSDATSFPLAAFLDLPDAAEIEADIEGLDAVDGWLWLVGSHGLKRKNPKAGRKPTENIKRLATIERDGNRCLLARIPLEADSSGLLNPVREARDGRCAARLRGDTRSNDLTRAIAEDVHLAPFLALPGKDNGFDVEGLAVRGEQILAGLRGPVLRGWSCVLELRCQEKKGELRLAKQGEVALRKHFIKLAGLGVRDLHWEGDDLLLLAGPTMALDGAIRLFRWHDAASALDANESDEMLWENVASEALSLDHGVGTDRAEALTRVPDGLLPPPRTGAATPRWLVLHDAPAPARTAAGGVVFADLLEA